VRKNMTYRAIFFDAFGTLILWEEKALLLAAK
jgi:FMN phosphatase YigB (HAD superfamily)